MPFIRTFKRYLAGRKEFPKEYERILYSKVRFWNRLNGRRKNLLKERMKIFMNEKIFEECGGLILTNEMRVIISAYACLLILEETSDYYPGLHSILVYPDDYVAPVYEVNSGGVITEGSERRQGESWESGSIVLSWNDIKKTTLNPENDHNLIIHEFAHQLDDQYGLSAGITMRGKSLNTDEWTKELSKIYRDLLDAEQFGRSDHPLDLYGATNPAECFAVFMEMFIESPRKLQSAYGAAYRLLVDFFGYDPGRSWDF